MEPVFPFVLTLTDAGSVGLTRSLHRELRAAVIERRLPDGFALPSTRRLAEFLSVGRNTVIGAYDLLVAEGHARARPGARLVVVGLPPHAAPTSQRVCVATPACRQSDVRIASTWRLPAAR